MDSELTYVGTVEPVSYSSESEIGNYEYSQRTPLRLVGNVGYIIKKIGFLSAEVEWLDYAANKYNFGNALNAGDLQIENAVNNTINNIFQSAVNIKIGGEFVIKESYRVRGGYAMFGNPYVSNTEFFNSSQFSVGTGYRKDDFFLDLAYIHRVGNEFYQPYDLESASPLVEKNLSADQIVLTFGVKFGGKR